MNATDVLCEALDALLANDTASAADAFRDLADLVQDGDVPNLTVPVVLDVIERAKRIAS
jgi:hypothetical protein